jgi:hypothetical protein
LLAKHSFLHKNQKLCPKISGLHIITRLKVAVDIELLLDTGRHVVVHVNRIKPFLMPGPGISSQNRGGVTETSFDDAQDNETSMGLEQQPAQRLMRSKTKQQGLVFDKTL